MAKTVGVVMTEKVVAGLLEDHKVVGELKHFPEVSDEGHDAEENGGLIELPADALAELLCELIATLAPAGSGVEAAGIAVPGIVRNGVIEDSPNLQQLKGANILGDGQECPGGARAGLQHERAERCRRGRGGRGGHPGTTGSAGARVDHRQWHRIRTVPLYRRPLGGWTHRGHPRSQGEILRLRRQGTPRRHHRPPRHAAPLPGPGAG